MNSRIRILTISCAVVLLAGIVAAFTVDGDDGELASVDGTTSTTAGDNLATDGSATTAKPKEGSGGDDSTTTTTTEVGSSSTTAAPASSTTTTEATTTTAQATTTTAASGPTPTTQGSYAYTVTGTEDGESVDTTATLTVSAVDGDGRQTHHQVRDDGEGESTTVYRYAAEGTYLESMTLNAEGQTINLTAEGDFLLIPTDAAAGTITNGTLTGNGLTADVTFELREISGATSTAQVDAHIYGTVFGCEVDGTMENTVVARSSDRLPIDTHAVSDMNATGGVLCPGKITSDVRSVLQQ